jgi:hypothetical protein
LGETCAGRWEPRQCVLLDDKARAGAKKSGIVSAVVLVVVGKDESVYGVFGEGQFGDLLD